jgi:hypothetical protein
MEACSMDMLVRQKKAADVYGEMMTYALGPGAQAETFRIPARGDRSIPVVRAR